MSTGRESMSQNFGKRHPSYTLPARSSGLPCPKILGHGTLVQKLVYVVRHPVTQNFGTRSPPKRKRVGGPELRVPTCWDTDTSSNIQCSGPEFVYLNCGTRQPSYTLAARPTGIPCPKILGHGTLVKHSFMCSGIPCPKIVGHGNIVKASVLAVRTSVSQHFGTRNPRETFVTAVPNSVSQDFGTRTYRKTVDSAVRKSLSEYLGSRKIPKHCLLYTSPSPRDRG